MNHTEGLQIMSDEIFEKKLDFFLRSSGRLFPITPAQVEAFEKQNPNHPTTTPLIDPISILQKGYMNFTLPTISEEFQPENEWQKMAARNGTTLSPETLRKMHEDRKNDENQ